MPKSISRTLQQTAADVIDLAKEKNSKKHLIQVRQRIYRCCKEVTPTITEVQECRLSVARHQLRTKQAENKVDLVVAIAEKALQDGDKNELVRALECIIRECGYDDSLDPISESLQEAFARNEIQTSESTIS